VSEGGELGCANMASGKDANLAAEKRVTPYKAVSMQASEMRHWLAVWQRLRVETWCRNVGLELLPGQCTPALNVMTSTRAAGMQGLAGQMARQGQSNSSQ
jgi:hypothetical protein